MSNPKEYAITAEKTISIYDLKSNLEVKFTKAAVEPAVDLAKEHGPYYYAHAAKAWEVPEDAKTISGEGLTHTGQGPRRLDGDAATEPPAADSVDAPTYLDYRMPSDRRDEVRRLGACWDAIRSRYYVPAGVGLVAFEGWRERPPKS